MEFKDIPYDVQLIAAKCLADKLNGVSLFAEDGLKKPTEKEQAEQVRNAFLTLFSEREFEGDKKKAAEKLAATILGLQQLVAENEIIKTQVGHVVSAADDFAGKCL